jgi:parallel beta-helix repeat protein
MKLQSGNIDVTNMSSGNISNILDYVDRLDLNVVTVPVKINAADATSNTMSIDATSKSEAIAVIEELQDNNIFVILEAYPWINNGTVAETSWNPSTVSTWFTNYKSVLSTLVDDIANQYSVWGFNVASNLELIEDNSTEWIDVFDYVRNTKSYTGQIIYRTNWWVTAVWDTGPGSTTEAYNEKLANTLFSDDNLDIISISSYFELTEESTTEPSISTLESRLRSTTVTATAREQDVYAEIKAFWTNHGKRIFFGEIGFPDKESATYHPWNPNVSSTDSQIAQSNGFQAYKNVFKDEYWFIGASNFCIGTDSSNYSVKNKLAEETYQYFMEPEKKKIIDTGRYREVERVFVEDADGIFVNISDLENYDWVKNVTFDHDIDEDVMQLNLTVNRNIYKLNLSPFVSKSKLNVDGSGNFEPAINLNRKVYVETAIVPMDIEPSETDYEEVFRGIIQNIDFQNENGIKLVVDDLGSQIRDKYIEEEKTYGVITSLSSAVSSGASSIDVKDATGLSADNIILIGDDNGYEQVTISSVSSNTLNLSSSLSNSYEKGAGINKLIALETAIQDMLDDNLSISITLYVPNSPQSFIKSFKQGKEGLFFAIKNKVMQIGWKVGYKWDASTDSFRFTLYEPERNNVIPEHVFNKSEYSEPQRLGISKSSIRNVISVLYPDPSNPEKDKQEIVSDTDSIDEYSRLFMEFTEGATSQINNETEANTLANYTLSDLKEPKANLDIPIDYYPYVYLTELCRFKANDEYFDTDQDLAIVSYQHNITKGETILTCRGNPSGYYNEWLRREAKPGIAPASKFPDTITGVTTDSGLLEIAQTNSAYIEVDWNEPTEKITYYEIRYRKNGSTEWNYFNAKSSYIKIEPLVPNIQYDIQVRSLVIHGGTSTLNYQSSWTSVVNETTPADSTAPSAPTSLNVIGIKDGISVAFDTPTEPDWGTCKVYLSNDSTIDISNSSTYIDTQTGKQTNFKFNDLTAGNTYYAKVSVIDTSGNESSSNPQGSATASYINWSEIFDDGNRPSDNATENRTLYQSSEPTDSDVSGSLHDGDIWIDSDGGSTTSPGAPYIYDGTNDNWIRATWNEVKSDDNAPVDNATKNDLIRQSSEPNPENYSQGDMWVDSDNGNPYIHDGTDWNRTTWNSISGDTNAPSTSSSLVVAASDTSTRGKNNADYVCDGTSDQTEINNAISALPAGGGAVKLLEGTFIVDGGINIPDNVTLTGQGKSTSLKIDGSVSSDFAVIENNDTTNGNTNIDIYDLLIDCNVNNATGNNTGIHIVGCSDVKVKTVKIIDSRYFGVHFENTTDSEITSCTMRNNTNSTAIYLASSSDNVVSQNIIRSWYSGIITNTSSNNIIISDNTIIEGGGFGIEMVGEENVVGSNIIRLKGQVGMYIEGFQCRVTNNTCFASSQNSDTTYSNITLDSVNECNVQHNTCRKGSNTNKPAYGIAILSGNDNFVTNNDLLNGGDTSNFYDGGTGTVTTAGNRT